MQQRKLRRVIAFRVLAGPGLARDQLARCPAHSCPPGDVGIGQHTAQDHPGELPYDLPHLARLAGNNDVSAARGGVALPRASLVRPGGGGSVGYGGNWPRSGGRVGGPPSVMGRFLVGWPRGLDLVGVVGAAGVG